MSTVVNLTFHGIGQPQTSLSNADKQMWVSESSFSSILDLIKDRHNVRLTFDDGNESDINVVLPALIERNLIAEFFITAGYVDKPNFLNAQHIRTLFDAGMKIGSHGMHHRSWRIASNSQLKEEIYLARDILQDIISQKIKSAACPFGEYDRRALKMLKQAGYERVFTIDRGKANENDWLQARNSVTRDDDATSIAYLIDNDVSIITRSIRKTKLFAKRLR